MPASDPVVLEGCSLFSETGTRTYEYKIQPVLISASVRNDNLAGLLG